MDLKRRLDALARRVPTPEDEQERFNVVPQETIDIVMAALQQRIRYAIAQGREEDVADVVKIMIAHGMAVWK